MKYQNIFIIGNPRSGTSLFRIMMSSHSAIVVPPECGFIQWWYSKYKHWSINDSEHSNSIDLFISDLKTSKKIETWSLNYKVLKNLISNRKPKTYSELVTLVIEQYGIQLGKNPTVFGDKNNYYIDHLDVIKQINPNAKYLVIIRDCRDVVCSYLNVNALETNSPYKPVFSDKIEDISKEWVENNNKIIEFTKRLNASNYVYIKYEDLLCKPEEVLKQCTDLLGLGFDENMLKYYEQQLEPSELLAWKAKTMKKIDASSIGRYKNQLSLDQIKVIESTANTLMAKYGYI